MITITFTFFPTSYLSSIDEITAIVIVSCHCQPRRKDWSAATGWRSTAERDAIQRQASPDYLNTSPPHARCHALMTIVTTRQHPTSHPPYQNQMQRSSSSSTLLPWQPQSTIIFSSSMPMLLMPLLHTAIELSCRLLHP